MMVGMTAKAKIAVTLPADLVESARDAVRAGRASSVSGYVADSLRQRAAADDLDALLAEMLERSGGPLTDAERAEVDEAAGWQ